jgi:tRNA uridine 5-carboxymethylaminomethyl modification enzyme
MLQTSRLNGQSLAEHLRRPEMRLETLIERACELRCVAASTSAIEAVEIRAKYAGYLEREQRAIERHRHMESRSIPESFEYAGISELRVEAREKFTRFRPRSLGQAARISGISPADIATLSIYLARSPKR